MKIILPLTLLATILTGSSADNANLRRGLGRDNGLPTQSAEDARAEDINIISRQTGWKHVDVLSHMDLQDSFKELVAGLEDDNRFNDAMMGKEPGAKPKLLFKNGVPPGIEAKIAKFEAENGVRIERIATKFSRKDNTNRQKRIQNKLKSKGFGEMVLAIIGDELMISANKPPNNDKIKPSPVNHKVPPGQVDKAAADILELDEGDDQLYGVKLDIYDGAELFQNEDVRGGRCLMVDTFCSCTSAFSVRHRSTGETGVSTAAHCDNLNMYQSEPPHPNQPLTLKEKHYGSYGDIAWYTSPDEEVPEYWASPYSIRPVTGWDYYPSVNEWVCFYSRKNGNRRCVQVYANKISGWSSYGWSGNLVTVTENPSKRGDSGGPWSWGTTAYGVHKGYVKIDYADRGLYSQIRWMREALNVDVLTT